MDYDYGDKAMGFYHRTDNTDYTEGVNNMNNDTMNQEVVIENKSNNEMNEQQLLVQEFKKNYVGERVNMADMESIFHYGEDALLELENVVTASSNDLGNHKIGEAQTIIKEKIDSIINFNPNLDKEEKIQRKIDERAGTLLGRIINKFTGDYKLAGRDTYTDACKKVEDNCEDIARIVDETGLRVTEEFKAGIQYHSEQERVLDELNNLVTMGRIDLDEYERKVALKKEMGPQLGEDPQKFEIQIKKAETNIQDFKEKLETLESAKVLGYNDLAKNMELQQVNKKSMKQLYNIKTATLPMLRVAGKDAIRVRNASDTLDVIETVNDGLNQALQINSKKNLENIQRSQTISTKGTIYIETINQVVKDLAEGKKAIEQGDAQDKKALENRKKANVKAITEITKITEAIKKQVNYNENDVELLESMTLPELPEATVTENQSTNTVNANTTAKSPLLKSIYPPKSGN